MSKTSEVSCAVSQLQPESGFAIFKIAIFTFCTLWKALSGASHISTSWDPVNWLSRLRKKQKPCPAAAPSCGPRCCHPLPLKAAEAVVLSLWLLYAHINCTYKCKTTLYINMLLHKHNIQHMDCGHDERQGPFFPNIKYLSIYVHFCYAILL